MSDSDKMIDFTSSKVITIVGAQWGDEGKGKVVDILGAQANVVARYNGGSNAGHTIIVGDKKFAFHLVPSAVLHPKCECLLGNGVVVNLESLATELLTLDDSGIDYRGRFFISDRAHLLFSFHKVVDELRETSLKSSKSDLGTTKQGIGPCYATKANRIGVRVGDLLDFDEVFVPRIRALFDSYCREFGAENFSERKIEIEAEITKYRQIAKTVEPMIIDGLLYIHDAIKAGKNILIEGANAVMLDIDFGTYPYVTSSSPAIGGAATGLGVPPQLLNNTIGIVKAYTTRVGEGPFLSEDSGEQGKLLQQIGREFGVTTGRSRRCGWIDIPQLKYSAMICNYLQLSLSKLDVLDTFDEIKIVTAYEAEDGTHLPAYPASLIKLGKCKPVYQIVPGWKTSIAHIRKYSELPTNARNYIELVEKLVGVPFTSIGVGPKRDDMIFKTCK